MLNFAPLYPIFIYLYSHPFRWLPRWPHESAPDLPAILYCLRRRCPRHSAGYMRAVLILPLMALLPAGLQALPPPLSGAPLNLEQSSLSQLE